ncbi:MAG: hypothetical protein HN396_18620 [Gemmatimonadales bacterium]|jgi:hypothetical protein|nr:hypothetical protein [Gemmatimonadales bacterium]
MCVVFLDIDGVLNNSELRTRFYEQHGRIARLESVEQLCPVLVGRLNRLFEQTGARIVISSIWRMHSSIGKIKRMLMEMGLDREHIRRMDKTPGGGGPRGPQIDEWLRAQPEGLVTSFVILDDGSDMEPNMDRLVHVDGHVGLTEQHVDQAIRMLNQEG